MNSILTIITAAESQDLTTLETIKAELNIAVSGEDTLLQRYIRQASNLCATYCNRVFGEEVATEQFRLVGYRNEVLALSRFPVASIAFSVTENDTALTTADYEIDPNSGLLYRLWSDVRTCWPCGKIVVVYTAGYALLGALPDAIEDACIELVKAAWYARSRDPAIKSEQTEGVDAVTYFFGTPGKGGLPEAVTVKLDPFRDLRLA